MNTVETNSGVWEINQNFLFDNANQPYEPLVYQSYFIYK